MKKDVQIDGDRVLLRTLTIDDVSERYVEWMSDKFVTEYLEVEDRIYTKDEMLAYVSDLYDNDRQLLLGIFIKESETHRLHIGNFKVGPINYNHSRTPVGLMIGDRNYWGKGIAAEVIKLATTYIFRDLGLERVYAGCYEHHVASKRAFQKAGYQTEGLLRSHCSFQGRRQGSWRFGVLKNDYS